MNEKWHNFDTNSTLPPTLRVSLIQADSSFKMSDFNQPVIAGNGVRTNHGAVTLRPTGGDSGETTRITSSISDGLGGSALSDFENYDNSNYNRFDLGVTFGLQLSFKNIYLEGGYTMGLLNRWKDAPADCNMKANQLFFGVGYGL